VPPGQSGSTSLQITPVEGATKMTSTILANRNAEKQRRLRERRLQQGLRLHSVWVPEEIIADINQIAEKARNNRNLECVVILRDRITGQFTR